MTRRSHADPLARGDESNNQPRADVGLARPWWSLDEQVARIEPGDQRVLAGEVQRLQRRPGLAMSDAWGSPGEDITNS